MFANVLTFHMSLYKISTLQAPTPPYHLTMQIKINTRLPFAHRDLKQKNTPKKSSKNFPTKIKARDNVNIFWKSEGKKIQLDLLNQDSVDLWGGKYVLLNPGSESLEDMSHSFSLGKI